MVGKIHYRKLFWTAELKQMDYKKAGVKKYVNVSVKHNFRHSA